MSKRFFRCDDNGNLIFFVVDEDQDSDYCSLVLRKTLGDGALACDEPGGQPLEWMEITRDQASIVYCNTDDDERGRGRISLADADMGEFFSTEY